MTPKENAFKVSRKNYEANFLTGLRELRADSELFDITLGCSDPSQRFLQAHRVVLSACSAFFKTMFKHQASQPNTRNAYIYLKGVTFKELNYVLDYMYQGEVNVNESDLDSFLAVSEELEIEGLSTKDPQEKTLRQQKINGIKSDKPFKSFPTPSFPIRQPVKTDPDATKKVKRRTSEEPLLKRLKQKIPDFGDGEDAEDNIKPDQEESGEATGLSIAKLYDSEHALENIQENYSRDPETKMFKCIFQELDERTRTHNICGYESKAKQCIEDHVTAKHFPQKKPCAFCGKLQKDGGSLRSHMYACTKRDDKKEKEPKEPKKLVKTEPQNEDLLLGF